MSMKILIEFIRGFIIGFLSAIVLKFIDTNLSITQIIIISGSILAITTVVNGIIDAIINIKIEAKKQTK